MRTIRVSRFVESSGQPLPIEDGPTKARLASAPKGCPLLFPEHSPFTEQLGAVGGSQGTNQGAAGAGAGTGASTRFTSPAVLASDI